MGLNLFCHQEAEINSVDVFLFISFGKYFLKNSQKIKRHIQHFFIGMETRIMFSDADFVLE